MTPTRFNALWNHFGKTIFQIGKRQNRNESSKCSGNIQGCVSISNLCWLIVLQAVLKAMRVHWRPRPCSGKPRTGIPWPPMKWAPSGRLFLRPSSAPCGFPLPLPVGPWHVCGNLRRSSWAPSTLACWALHVGVLWRSRWAREMLTVGLQGRPL